MLEMDPSMNIGWNRHLLAPFRALYCLSKTLVFLVDEERRGSSKSRQKWLLDFMPLHFMHKREHNCAQHILTGILISMSQLYSNYTILSTIHFSLQSNFQC